jgi:hypothetical protein
MINHCKEKEQFGSDPIRPGECGHYWAVNGACVNPHLHALLQTQRQGDGVIRICPTKGVRP